MNAHDLELTFHMRPGTEIERRCKKELFAALRANVGGFPYNGGISGALFRAQFNDFFGLAIPNLETWEFITTAHAALVKLGHLKEIDNDGDK